MDGTEGDAESDGLSAFSFSIYDIDFGEREIERPLSPTPSSAFSRSSFATQGQGLELDDATFELDYRFGLPPSIAGTRLFPRDRYCNGFGEIERGRRWGY